MPAILIPVSYHPFVTHSFVFFHTSLSLLPPMVSEFPYHLASIRFSPD